MRLAAQVSAWGCAGAGAGLLQAKPSVWSRACPAAALTLWDNPCRHPPCFLVPSSPHPTYQQSTLLHPSALLHRLSNHHNPRPARHPQLLFFDTEGFESTGKADVYDDRIFALAALVSQVLAHSWTVQLSWWGVVWCGARPHLWCTENATHAPPPPHTHTQTQNVPPQVLVYNLPEAIRESDLEKLSFAVELSKAFYDADDRVRTWCDVSQWQGACSMVFVWLTARHPLFFPSLRAAASQMRLACA